LIEKGKLAVIIYLRIIILWGRSSFLCSFTCHILLSWRRYWIELRLLLEPINYILHCILFEIREV